MSDANTTNEWGAYVRGERIEIEQGPWSKGELAGLPEFPGMARSTDGYYLVQRATPSPHPMIWHSKRYDNVEKARDAYAWRRFIEAEEDSVEQKLRIPGVSEFAFAFHHSHYGCAAHGDVRSVAECTNNHECVERAVAQVGEVIDRSRVVGMMLS